MYSGYIIYCMMRSSKNNKKKHIKKRLRKPEEDYEDDELLEDDDDDSTEHRLLSENVQRWLITTVLAIIAVFLLFSIFGYAGIAGEFTYNRALMPTFGYGAIFVPIAILTIIAYRITGRRIWIYEWLGLVGLLISIVAFLDITVSTAELAAGGTLGTILGGHLFVKNFGIVLGMLLVVALGFIAGFILYDPRLVSIRSLLQIMMDRNIPEPNVGGVEYEEDDDEEEEDDEEDEGEDDEEDEEEDDRNMEGIRAQKKKDPPTVSYTHLTLPTNREV